MSGYGERDKRKEGKKRSKTGVAEPEIISRLIASEGKAQKKCCASVCCLDKKLGDKVMKNTLIKQIIKKCIISSFVLLEHQSVFVSCFVCLFGCFLFCFVCFCCCCFILCLLDRRVWLTLTHPQATKGELKAYSLMLNRGCSQNFQNLIFLHIFVAFL